MLNFLNMKKIVLVTGATSGIGEACARVFARGGYDVIVTGRRAERLEALRKELETLGAAVKTLQFDVRDAEAWQMSALTEADLQFHMIWIWRKNDYLCK